MRMRRWLLAAACLTAGSALTSPRAHAQAARPCAECHKPAVAEYRARKFVHDPVAKNDCEACHKRHGFAQQLVLQRSEPELCTTCHQDVAAALAAAGAVGAPGAAAAAGATPAASTHLGLPDVGCGGCHDPHASDTKGLLRADRAQTCATCHPRIQAALASTKPHQPFAERKCETCHAAHTAPQPHLLLAPQEELCARCHGSKAELPELHQRPEVAGAPCSSCHDPHAGSASTEAGFIHSPYAQAECGACHSGLPDRPQQLTASTGELCGGCHGDVSQVAAAAGGHPPAAEGDCTFCHDPHKSDRAALLKGDAETLCTPCHDGLREQQKQQSVHAPFTELACTKCHAPHGATQPHMLAQEPQQLCRSCHAPVEQKATAAKAAHPPMQEECGTCHAAHASDQPALLRSNQIQTCGQCHADVIAQQSQPVVHLPFRAGECSDCHGPHGTDVAGMLVRSDPGLCLPCHREQVDQKRMAKQHAPFAQGECQTCHRPHASTAGKLLVASQPELCGGCHADVLAAPGPAPEGGAATPAGSAVPAAAALHEPVANGNCSACHDAHAVQENPSLLRATGFELCTTCHGALKDTFTTGVVHAPVRDGNCAVCHDGHRTKDAQGHVVTKTACTGCHDAQAGQFKQVHGEFTLDAASCTTCHDPHRSDKPGLLRQVRHEPFGADACGTCHAPPAPGRAPALVAEQGELCATCHGAIEAPPAPRELHAAVAMGECSGCHDPHVADASKLLRGKPGEVCANCHGDLTQSLQSAPVELVHAPAARGECSTCHGGHQGLAPGLLQQPVPELCGTCHAPVLERARAKGGHAPARDGKCLECHDPHVGKADGLLATDTRALCERCHDTKVATFQAAHGGYQTATGRCTSCHDPHGSTQKGLLPAFAHAPYAEKECGSCHASATEMVANGADLCTTCHGEHADDAQRPFPHAAVVDARSCLNCHSPHAGKTPSLLVREDMPSTCMGCHSRELFEKKNRHPKLDAQCATCHDVHGAQVLGLLKAPQEELCSQCHDAARTHFHPFGAPLKDPRTGQTLSCSSCHSPHSSDQEALLTYDKQRQLCVQCHLGSNLEVMGAGVH